MVRSQAVSPLRQSSLLVRQSFREPEVDDVQRVRISLERDPRSRTTVEGEEADAMVFEEHAKFRPSHQPLPRQEVEAGGVSRCPVARENTPEFALSRTAGRADKRGVHRDNELSLKARYFLGELRWRHDQSFEAHQPNRPSRLLEDTYAGFEAPGPRKVDAHEGCHATILRRQSLGGRPVSATRTLRFMAKQLIVPDSATGKSARAVIRECGKAAGQIMRDRFGRATVTAVKGRGDVLTETDTAVERAVMAILRREYPTHAILSEESAADVRSFGWMWVIDPVDGTKNFSRGLPHFAFNIALCHEEEPQIALTVHPPLHEEFLALRGKGCFLNNRKITVSDVRTVRQSVVAIDLGYDNDRARRQIETALHLWPGMESLRVPGGPALGMAYLAAGRWDVYVHTSLKPWDVAAGLLLVAEAGGVVSDRMGAPATIFSDSVVAGTSGTHADFIALTTGLPWRA